MEPPRQIALLLQMSVLQLSILGYGRKRGRWSDPAGYGQICSHGVLDY